MTDIDDPNALIERDGHLWRWEAWAAVQCHTPGCQKQRCPPALYCCTACWRP